MKNFMKILIKWRSWPIVNVSPTGVSRDTLATKSSLLWLLTPSIERWVWWRCNTESRLVMLWVFRTLLDKGWLALVTALPGWCVSISKTVSSIKSSCNIVSEESLFSQAICNWESWICSFLKNHFYYFLWYSFEKYRDFFHSLPSLSPHWIRR